MEANIDILWEDTINMTLTSSEDKYKGPFEPEIASLQALILHLWTCNLASLNQP